MGATDTGSDLVHEANYSWDRIAFRIFGADGLPITVDFKAKENVSYQVDQAALAELGWHVESSSEKDADGAVRADQIALLTNRGRVEINTRFDGENQSDASDEASGRMGDDKPKNPIWLANLFGKTVHGIWINGDRNAALESALIKRKLVSGALALLVVAGIVLATEVLHLVLFPNRTIISQFCCGPVLWCVLGGLFFINNRVGYIASIVAVVFLCLSTVVAPGLWLLHTIGFLFTETESVKPASILAMLLHTALYAGGAAYLLAVVYETRFRLRFLEAQGRGTPAS